LGLGQLAKLLKPTVSSFHFVVSSDEQLSSISVMACRLVLATTLPSLLNPTTLHPFDNFVFPHPEFTPVLEQFMLLSH
jgi:hypothetical protein